MKLLTSIACLEWRAAKAKITARCVRENLIQSMKQTWLLWIVDFLVEILRKYMDLMLLYLDFFYYLVSMFHDLDVLISFLVFQDTHTYTKIARRLKVCTLRKLHSPFKVILLFFHCNNFRRNYIYESFISILLTILK